jgi:hypothetical protein
MTSASKTNTLDIAQGCWGAARLLRRHSIWYVTKSADRGIVREHGRRREALVPASTRISVSATTRLRPRRSRPPHVGFTFSAVHAQNSCLLAQRGQLSSSFRCSRYAFRSHSLSVWCDRAGMSLVPGHLLKSAMPSRIRFARFGRSTGREGRSRQLLP